MGGERTPLLPGRRLTTKTRRIASVLGVSSVLVLAAVFSSYGKEEILLVSTKLPHTHENAFYYGCGGCDLSGAQWPVGKDDSSTLSFPSCIKGFSLPDLKEQLSLLDNHWLLMMGDDSLEGQFFALADRFQVQQECPQFGNFTNQPQEFSLICKKDNSCTLRPLGCMHFTLPGPVVGVDNFPACSTAEWLELVKTIASPDVEFAVTFHWVPATIGRAPPQFVHKPEVMIGEGPLSTLSADPLAARFTLDKFSVPGAIVLGGCSVVEDWPITEADYAVQQRVKLYTTMVENNILLIQAAGFNGLLSVQTCAEESCRFFTDDERPPVPPPLVPAAPPAAPAAPVNPQQVATAFDRGFQAGYAFGLSHKNVNAAALQLDASAAASNSPDERDFIRGFNSGFDAAVAGTPLSGGTPAKSDSNGGVGAPAAKKEDNKGVGAPAKPDDNKGVGAAPTKEGDNQGVPIVGAAPSKEGDNQGVPIVGAAPAKKDDNKGVGAAPTKEGDNLGVGGTPAKDGSNGGIGKSNEAVASATLITNNGVAAASQQQGSQFEQGYLRGFTSAFEKFVSSLGIAGAAPAKTSDNAAVGGSNGPQKSTDNLAVGNKGPAKKSDNPAVGSRAPQKNSANQGVGASSQKKNANSGVGSSAAASNDYERGFLAGFGHVLDRFAPLINKAIGAPSKSTSNGGVGARPAKRDANGGVGAAPAKRDANKGVGAAPTKDGDNQGVPIVGAAPAKKDDNKGVGAAPTKEGDNLGVGGAPAKNGANNGVGGAPAKNGANNGVGNGASLEDAASIFERSFVKGFSFALERFAKSLGIAGAPAKTTDNAAVGNKGPSKKTDNQGVGSAPAKKDANKGVGASSADAADTFERAFVRGFVAALEHIRNDGGVANAVSAPQKSTSNLPVGAPAQKTDSNQAVTVGAPSQKTDSNQPITVGAPAQKTDSNQPITVGAPAQKTDSNQPVNVGAPSQKSTSNQPVNVGIEKKDANQAVGETDEVAQSKFIQGFLAGFEHGTKHPSATPAEAEASARALIAPPAPPAPAPAVPPLPPAPEDLHKDYRLGFLDGFRAAGALKAEQDAKTQVEHEEHVIVTTTHEIISSDDSSSGSSGSASSAAAAKASGAGGRRAPGRHLLSSAAAAAAVVDKHGGALDAVEAGLEAHNSENSMLSADHARRTLLADPVAAARAAAAAAKAVADAAAAAAGEGSSSSSAPAAQPSAQQSEVVPPFPPAAPAAAAPAAPGSEVVPPSPPVDELKRCLTANKNKQLVSESLEKMIARIRSAGSVVDINALSAIRPDLYSSSDDMCSYDVCGVVQGTEDPVPYGTALPVPILCDAALQATWSSLFRNRHCNVWAPTPSHENIDRSAQHIAINKALNW